MKLEVGLASLMLGMAILLAMVLFGLAVLVSTHPLWLPRLERHTPIRAAAGNRPITWDIQHTPRAITEGEALVEVSEIELLLHPLVENETTRPEARSSPADNASDPAWTPLSTPPPTPWPGPPVRNSPLAGWPVPGEMSQNFGCSVYYSGIPGPDCPTETPWFHDGIDLAAPLGQPVRAALTGTVIFAGADGSGPACGDYRGYGLGVVIDTDDGWQALYAHLSYVEVVTGQEVTPQTIIGAVGETGCVSGPHLHFGLRHQGTLVDPQEYLLTER